MRFRAKKLFRKIKARPHMIIWVSLGITTTLLLSTTIYAVTERNLDKQRANRLEQLSEVNTIAGNIPQSDVLDEFTKDYQQTTVSLVNLTNKFSEVDEYNQSILNSILHASKSEGLEKTAREITQFAKDKQPISANLAYQFSTLEMFLNYDPLQDFANYGIDQNDDSERISRAKTAFTALILISDSGLNKDIRDAILESERALDELKATNDIQTLTGSINQAKIAISASLSTSVSQLKNDVSVFYNQQLYQ